MSGKLFAQKVWKWLASASIPTAMATVLLASGGVIIVISTNLVSGTGQVAWRWEPSAAAGSTWVHSWAEFPVSNTNAFNSFVSAWNGSSWGAPFQLTAPNGVQQGDVNVAWDSVRNRFVFCTLDGPGGNVWYGYSTDSSGTNWIFQPAAVFPSSTGFWDYPSIGVDASGRIIMGAVNLYGTGYFSAISSDGYNFSSPSLVVNPSTGHGARSRVVATNSLFEAFVPELDSNYNPTAVDRYESADGVSWAGPYNLATFAAPLNNSPSSPYIFYAPLLAATGYTNGLWAMAIQINNGGYNNVFICSSDRGCGIVNGGPDDQFLNGISVSGDQGYWISYLTYSTLNTRQLPLITQAIYFPLGQGGIGATTNTGIDPTSWIVRPAGNRCSMACYAAGDYNTVASNSFAAATTPFVRQDNFQTDIYQSFTEDPQATANVPNFKPNFIPYAVGSDLRSLGVVNPATAPLTQAQPPNRTVGIALH